MYRKEYYKKNRERINENRKRYYLKHREEIASKQKEYYFEHREKCLTQSRERAISRGLEGYRKFILDRLDERNLPMFDDILINREIAEIEVRIKFRKLEEE